MAIDLISVPTVTMEVADIVGDVIPRRGRITTTLSRHLDNTAETTVLDYADDAYVAGTDDLAPAVGRALVAIRDDGSAKRLRFPSGDHIMRSGISGIVGNDGYHGLVICGHGNYGTRILKQFNGDLFTMDAVLGLKAYDIGFDGGYGTYTGRGFVLTGNCNQPRFECDFAGFSDSHIKFGPDCGYNAHISTNHFSGAGQGDYRAIHIAGPDTTATPRTFVGMIANGYVQVDGGLDTLITGCMATRYVIDNNCNETCIAASVWADQQNFLAGIPITIGGHQTQVVGCRFANAIVLAAGSSGALVGNRQSGVPVGLDPLTDDATGQWAIFHPGFAASYHWVGPSKTTATVNNGELVAMAVTAWGDTSGNLEVDVNATCITVNAPLTAARTITLLTTNARNGSTFHIKRNGGNTGGPWALTIAGGTGAVLNNNEWCTMIYNGAFWECFSFGSL